MTLRKITIFNRVKYVSKVDQFHTEQTPTILTERKKTVSSIKLSQKNKKFIKNITGEKIETIK